MSFLNKVLKGFLGDKKAQDLKEVKKVVTKIKAVEPTIQQLSDDGLRDKTAEFKESIKTATSKITAQIEQIQEQIKASTNVDEKEALFSKIEALKKESYEIEEKILLQILPEAFALVKETARRWAENGEIRVTATDWDRQLAAAGKDFLEIQGDQAVWKNSWDAAGTPVNWDMVHYDVQFIGGVILHSGKIAEMATGEGKTLVGTLPIFLNALPGRGVHVVTVNDYLAKRDSAWMGPLYQFHGMSIDCIDNHQPNSDGRRKAYNSDITYGTNNEFGFDYLRDNMVTSPSELVQRELNFAIVDEVDSVLVDDARTPLIISGPVPQGDRQEFDVLKPSIDRIVEVQKKTVSAIFNEAKKLIAAGNTKEGGFKLLQAYRGLPKNRQLIKFLSESGNRALLQKTEAQYMQDNNRDMPIVDKDLYFVIEEKNNQVDLTDKGVEYMSQGNEDNNFFVLPDIGTEIAELEAKNLSKEEEFEAKEKLFSDFAEKSERVHTMSQLLKAYTLFEKDDEYVVIDGEVKIVDEQTGRIMEGRRYSDGLHQAIEAKENVKIEAATQTFATITLQNYFRMYNKLAGMTGTAETEAGELWEIYKLDVVVIPTNRPILRNDKQDLVFKTNREKYNAVIEEIEKLTAARRPVLVGTTSVEISQLLSKALQLRKIPHQVLNAKLHKKEAEIVAGAGQPGVVTIATNMAGRGTDIKLSKEVKEAGGLAIIGTERHDSRRVDRQLRGRAGRQGDPGSSQFYVSLEDNLMRLFGSERIAKMMDRMGHKEGEVIQHSMISKSIERAQKKVEENNFGTRKRLLEYDDVMNKQRDVIYKRRKNALFGDHLKYDIANMIFDVANSIVNKGKATGSYKDFEYEIIKTFTMESPVSENDFKNKTVQELTNLLFQAAQDDYQMKLNLLKEKSFPIIENVYQNQGSMFKMIQVPFTDGHKTLTIVADLKEAYDTKCESLVNDFEKNITLSIIDENWKLHLREMDDLRKSSQGAVYEQKDPLVIYKQESFHLFSEMIDRLNKEIISFLYKGEIPS
ncbi:MULTISPECIES: preprotein translocase subunit SecA [Chryseobacterium]|jgi:preprotein translocase subunit SecA|uniref:Protein translocase subunit SecA n=1 Tax=Chryseobacterium geocarposphaerae TaxID=1416776 RepID=A0ABU1LEJ4_9FLAO|nr:MULTISPECIES: preprotein translocase subunit SecA [Chryseobacterium]ALR32215.1 preprotein translocase subunit SecA [Chryseobacterium sp. IHB B 17019]MDR6405137.1 preprotein translocase subunit SecA [Chryseobacterium geocarposphaerae]MDR6697920.1 preprotein translocase subunit SecA [Chryseobacterium ginsenosidimutans]